MSSDKAGVQITGTNGRADSVHLYSEAQGKDDQVDPSGATCDEIGTNNQFGGVRQNSHTHLISGDSDYVNLPVKQVNNYEELLPASTPDVKPVYKSLIRKS